MLKRYFDTHLWQKDDFLELPDRQKLLTLYLTANCDCVGMFCMSLKYSIFAFDNSALTEDEILNGFLNVEKHSEGKYWLVDFCKFQYGVLKENSSGKGIHSSYLRKLKEYGLYDRVEKIKVDYTVKPIKKPKKLTSKEIDDLAIEITRDS